MSNVSEPRVWTVEVQKSWRLRHNPSEALMGAEYIDVIEHSAFIEERDRCMRTEAHLEEVILEREAMRKERDEWKRAYDSANIFQLTQERDAALAERDHWIDREKSARFDVENRIAKLSTERDELRARLDAQRLINEAQAKAGEEMAAEIEILKRRNGYLEAEPRTTVMRERLTAERARAEHLDSQAKKYSERMVNAEKKMKALVEAVQWWIDFPNDPEMQDEHEKAYDAVKIALTAHRAQEGEE